MSERAEEPRRILCAHADRNGEGAHWKNAGEPCPLDRPRAGDEMNRPGPFDFTADAEVWSNMSVGDKRLTWREACERHEEELRRLRAMASTLTDLDRCEHGRHEGDVCGSCDGPSLGNPVYRYVDGTPEFTVNRQIGFDISGRPIVVPTRGERWAGE